MGVTAFFHCETILNQTKEKDSDCEREIARRGKTCPHVEPPVRAIFFLVMSLLIVIFSMRNIRAF